MAELLYVATKQRDIALMELMNDLATAGVKMPRAVAGAISKHLLVNNTQNFLTVERWAQRVSDAQPSNGFDGMVIAGSITNPGSRSFATVFEALRFFDGLGYVTVRIGVIARGGTVTETGNLGALLSLTAAEIVGTDGGDNANVGQGWTRWSLGGFSTTNSFLWRTSNLKIIIGGTPGVKPSFFEGSSSTLTAINCGFEGTADATTTFQPTLILQSACLLFDSYLLDVSPSSTTAFGCRFSWNITEVQTATGAWQHYGCVYGIIGNDNITMTVSGTAALIMDACTWANGDQDAGAGSAFYTLTSTTLRHVYITSSGQRTADFNKFIMQISGHISAYIQVVANAIVLGARGATFEGSCIGGTFVSTVDVTGPVTCNVQCERATIRGENVNGSMQITFSTSGGTALTGTGVTDSGLVVSARRSVASSTQKGYALDAASARNVIIFTGTQSFPTADTDVGTQNVVITEAGSPPGGAAGGDLSGSYPNPSVVDDSHGHTAATLPAIVYDGDAAGGDLSGTYPNPGVVDDSHAHTASTLSGVIETGDAAGGDLDGTYPNPVRAATPYVRASTTAGQALATGATVTLLWDTDDVDVFGMHDPTTNSERLTADRDGIWHVFLVSSVTANAVGDRRTTIRQGGGATIRARTTVATPTGGQASINPLSVDVPITSGDYVYADIFQNSGVGLNTSAGNTLFGMTWLGPIV